MTAGDLWLPKVLCGLVACFLGFLAAFFAYLETRRNDDHEPIREWFRAKWERLQKSRWRQMPEACVQWFLRIQWTLSKRLGEFVVGSRFWSFILGLCTIACLVCTQLNWETWGYAALLLCAWPVSYACMTKCWSGDGIRKRIFAILGTAAVLVLFCYCPIYVAVADDPIYILIVVSLVWVLFCSAILFSALGLLAYLKETKSISEKTIAQGFTVAAIMLLSFCVTQLSFLAGRLAHPSTHVHLTYWVLVSNAVCDVLTISATISILAWGVRRKTLLRLPIAVFCDITVAAILAILSIYLSLVFTTYALTLPQVASVLVGRSPTSDGYEFGPYFWAMHTTFIPTLLYLAVISVAWLGKAILTPVAWFFGEGHENKSPLSFTAAIMGLGAAIFGVLSYGLGIGEECLENHHPTTSQTAPSTPAIKEVPQESP